MTNPNLAPSVIRVLRQPGLANINFNMHGLIVMGQDYGKVADAVADGRIECLTVKDLPPQRALAAGVVTNASYKADLNAMLFLKENFGSTQKEELTIVHESTHAIFDITSTSTNRRILGRLDESAAVLAEALYIKLCNKPKGNYDMVEEDPQYEAWALANELMVATESFTIGPKPYVLTTDQTAKLIAAVSKNWGFTKKIEPNGTIADDRGLIYTYDGVPACASTAPKK